jgi:HTH-type transcriptional regulator/antitoxin HigA
MANVKTQENLPTKFNDLFAELPLRPIGDRVDLDNAMEMAGRLAVLSKRTKDQGDYLEVLSLLIEEYEAGNDPIDSDVDPVDALKYLMAGLDMNASDLGKLLGERSLGPKVLNRDRELSKSHIRKLSDYFKVGPSVFLGR